MTCDCDFCTGKKSWDDNWCARCAKVIMELPKWHENLDICDKCEEQMSTYSDIKAAMDEVEQELGFATAKFGPFNSAHEGYGVILEELDELWDEIKAKQGSRNVEYMRAEAKQVAAMAIRFMLDICTSDKGQR